MEIQIQNYSPFYRLFHQKIEKEKVGFLLSYTDDPALITKIMAKFRILLF